MLENQPAKPLTTKQTLDKMTAQFDGMTTSQIIDAQTRAFPATAEQKLHALNLALRDVPTGAIAQVCKALDIATPVWTWDPHAAINEQARTEHAIEHGRSLQVRLLKFVLEVRAEEDAITQ